MGILIKEGTTKRDWLKLAGATAETAFKSLTLGKDGFAAAISPLLRIFESLRGQDSTERRATRLVLETLTYAIAKTISSVQLGRPPLQPELEADIGHLLARVETLAAQNNIFLEASHLDHPSTFALFEDVASHIFHELQPNNPKSREVEVVAFFRASLTEGIHRVRTRNPEYYAPIFEILSGPNSRGDARTRAWDAYRELLVRRFEDEPLFGQDADRGVRLGQAYQSLRGFWEEGEAMRAEELTDLTNEPLLAYLLILSGYVSERWREAAENRNRVYEAIFDHIWTREREKPTRIHLNDLGKEGFESLLQALAGC